MDRDNHEGMTTGSGPIDTARVLVLIQGGILLTSTVESSLASTAFGLSPAVGLTAVSALLALTAAAGLVRRARWARKVTLFGEAYLLVTLLIDMAISLLMTQTPLGLVPLLTRGVVPVAVWRLLCQPAISAEFQPTTAPERSLDEHPVHEGLMP